MVLGRVNGHEALVRITRPPEKTGFPADYWIDIAILRMLLDAHLTYEEVDQYFNKKTHSLIELIEYQHQIRVHIIPDYPTLSENRRFTVITKPTTVIISMQNTGSSETLYLNTGDVILAGTGPDTIRQLIQDKFPHLILGFDKSRELWSAFADYDFSLGAAVKSVYADLSPEAKAVLKTIFLQKNQETDTPEGFAALSGLTLNEYFLALQELMDKSILFYEDKVGMQFLSLDISIFLLDCLKEEKMKRDPDETEE